MLDVIIWVALTMSLGTAVLAMWVFRTLITHGGIGADGLNPLELSISIVIFLFVLVAWCGFIIRKWRKR